VNFPEDVRYTREHEWAREQGGVVTVGITGYATDQLGDVVSWNCPTSAEAGRRKVLRRGGGGEDGERSSYAPVTARSSGERCVSDDPAGR